MIKMDNQLKLEAPWTEVKELIKEVIPELTDKDLEYEEGKENELLQRIADKTNRSVEHVKAWVESISSNSGKAS
jgi:uncharacterized protein YjbJ (UPF0337 family)